MSLLDFWNRLIYWLPPAVERELAAGIADAAPRRALRRQLWHALLRRWRTWLLLLAAILVTVVLGASVLALARGWFSWVARYPMPVMIALGTIVGFTMSWLMSRALLRELRELLTQRGVAVCRGCGYHLTGNTTGRCPECGHAVEPWSE